MSEEHLIRATINEAGEVVQILPDGSTAPFKRKMNWAAFDAMTDEDAEYNALMDPDYEPFLTDADRETIKTLVDPKVIRTKLKLTQVEFSKRFAIPLGTIRDWERRARFPDSAARAYLRVIAEDPETVAALLLRSAGSVAADPIPA